MKRGQLDQAESNIRQVLAVFPRDRLSLQQLGELCKIKARLPGCAGMLREDSWRSILEDHRRPLQSDAVSIGSWAGLKTPNARQRSSPISKRRSRRLVIWRRVSFSRKHAGNEQ